VLIGDGRSLGFGDVDSLGRRDDAPVVCRVASILRVWLNRLEPLVDLGTARVTIVGRHVAAGWEGRLFDLFWPIVRA
jgi:hypothetical protein